MFKSISLAARLALGFVSVLVLLLAVAITSGYAVRLLGKQVQQIVQVNNTKTDLANELTDSIKNLALGVRSAALFTDMDRQQLSVEIKNNGEAQAAFEKAESALTELLAGPNGTDEERKLMAEISQAAKLAIPEFSGALKQAGEGDTVATVLTLRNRVQPAELVLRAKTSEFVALQRKLNEATSSSAVALQKKALIIEIVLVVAALVVGAYISWKITLSVTAPIAQAMEVAEQIAQGDLSSEVHGQGTDETGRLLQAIGAMQDRLRLLVGGIRNAAESIRVASSEVASSNQDLSNRTEQTASNLQETAQSMEHLTGIVIHSADSAKQANALASSAAQVAARGGAVVAEVVSTMGEINTSSTKIADIITVIDGIAFQTNILALNAAVEAARAGEQGRGFAVVAAEVRTLAGRSAQAAKEIKALIDTSVDRVKRGSRLVADAGETMTEIVSSVQRVTDTIGEITSAASEQSDGISRINTAIASLDRMTQQNSALVEEGAAAAQSLRDQAVQLTDAVSTFKLDRQTYLQISS
jgi:methyl-accepting chemotaxis protein